MIVEKLLVGPSATKPADHLALEQLRSAASDSDAIACMVVRNPDRSGMEEIAVAFDLHPLALEDMVTSHQRPKVERYGEDLIVCLKTLGYVTDSDQVESGEISILLGRAFLLITIHGDEACLSDAEGAVREGLRSTDHGVASVLLGITHAVVEHYLLVLNEIDEDVSEVEVSVFAPQRTQDAPRIYTLKRELAEARRAIGPLREPARHFASGTHPEVPDKLMPFFRDVLDNLHTASDLVDQLDAQLSVAFEAHLAQISVQQNEDMRKISAGAALLVAPTLISSVYGMNFRHMPELSWYFGYPMALGLMLFTVGILWFLFKRSGWL